jgi:hypothetical protein
MVANSSPSLQLMPFLGTGLWSCCSLLSCLHLCPTCLHIPASNFTALFRRQVRPARFAPFGLDLLQMLVQRDVFLFRHSVEKYSLQLVSTI